MKPHRSTDWRLQLASMKKESTVIVHQHGTVKLTWILHLPPVSVWECLVREALTQTFGLWGTNAHGVTECKS